MAIWAFVKVVSLGYLLGLVSLSLATMLRHLLRHRLAPAQRAEAGLCILTGAFAFNSLLAIMIFLGVVKQQIMMTTPYFHKLMFGGWGLLITIAGGVLLVVSLILTWYSWRRGRIPAASGALEYIQFGGKRLRIHQGVPTISLVGVWHPELWVNLEYWTALSDEQRAIALHHEAAHLARSDNLTRLIVIYIASLYAVLPWMRWWVAGYELDCELAVDDLCRRRFEANEYVGLVVHATSYVLSWREPVIASHLSYSDQTTRLKILTSQSPRTSRHLGLALGSLAAGLSVAPAAALLLHPVSRCLCACYLGVCVQYSHTAVERCHLDDLLQLSRLLDAWCGSDCL